MKNQFSVRPVGNGYEVILPGMGRVAHIHSFDIAPKGVITRFFSSRIFSATDKEIRDRLLLDCDSQ
jgi:hypothetical protein